MNGAVAAPLQQRMMVAETRRRRRTPRPPAGAAALVERAPSLSAPLPRVVHASYSTSAMIGGVVAGNATGRRGGGVDAMLAATWAPTLKHGEWVVDSGAELMIAGSFIYPYAKVVATRPDVHVKGVDGALTPVDNLCRAVVALPDGDHTVCEILVCDPFEIALWSTEYMGCFGFSAPPMHSGSQSVVRTPTGCCVPLLHRPYRLMAPPRAPSADEFARPCSLRPGDFKSVPPVPALVAGLEESVRALECGECSAQPQSRPGCVSHSGHHVWAICYSCGLSLGPCIYMNGWAARPGLRDPSVTATSRSKAKRSAMARSMSRGACRRLTRMMAMVMMRARVSRARRLCRRLLMRLRRAV